MSQTWECTFNKVIYEWPLIHFLKTNHKWHKWHRIFQKMWIKNQHNFFLKNKISSSQYFSIQWFILILLKGTACLIYFCCFSFTFLLIFVLNLKRKVYYEILNTLFLYWCNKQNSSSIFFKSNLIWFEKYKWSDCNRIRTNIHLVHKHTQPFSQTDQFG